MRALMSAEWLKLRKRWMPRVILILLALIVVLAFWAEGTRAVGRADLFIPVGWLAALLFSAFFAPFFWPVLGGSWAGNEYSWGTIRMILTRRPSRIRYALASLTMLLLGIAVTLLILMVVAIASGIVVALLTKTSAMHGSAFTGHFFKVAVESFLSAWYTAAFYLLLAFAAGTIFRSAAIGIGVGIGSTLAEFVLEGIFNRLGGAWNDIALRFPAFYTNRLTQQVAAAGFPRGSDLASPGSRSASVTEAVAMLAIYSAILLGATLVVVRSRDVTA